MNTLLLDTVAWDLVLDASGNIALAAEPYAIVQDVASACRTFLGEVYYDTKQGVPYFQQILGKRPSAQLMKAALVAAAETVPDVASAQCVLQAGPARSVTGQVQVTTTSGVTAAVNASPFAPLPPPGAPYAGGGPNFNDPRNAGWTAI